MLGGRAQHALEKARAPLFEIYVLVCLRQHKQTLLLHVFSHSTSAEAGNTDQFWMHCYAVRNKMPLRLQTHSKAELEQKAVCFSKMTLIANTSVTFVIFSGHIKATLKSNVVRPDD